MIAEHQPAAVPARPCARRRARGRHPESPSMTAFAHSEPSPQSRPMTSTSRDSAATRAASRCPLPRSSASPRRCSRRPRPAARPPPRPRYRRPSARASPCAAARSRRSPTTATRASASPSISGSGAGTRAPPTFRPEALRATVDKALAIARYTAEDPAAGLADPDRLARDIPDLDLYHPWPLTVEEAIALGREAEAAALAVDRRLINTEGSTVRLERVGVRLREHARLSRRLPQLAPSHRLLGDRRSRRRWRDAARLLVHRRPRGRGPAGRGRCRAHRRRAHGAPARRPPAGDDRMPGALRGARGGRPDRRLRVRGLGRRALPQVVVPARFAGDAGVRAAGLDPRGAAHSARPRQRAVRQRRRGDRAARRRARTASSAAIFSAAIRRASSA